MPSRIDVPAADLLAAQAASFDVAVVRRRGGDLLAMLRLTRPSGAVVDFTLEIDANSDEPRVREEKMGHLPRFCPERHINAEGWFCLNFRPAERLQVRDPEGADDWWSRVWKFLSLQLLAAKLRRWPNNDAWAHGAAAHHQCGLMPVRRRLDWTPHCVRAGYRSNIAADRIS